MPCLKLLKKYLIDSQLFVAAMGTCFSAFFMLNAGKAAPEPVLLTFITYLSGYVYTKFHSSRYTVQALLVNVFCGLSCLVLIFIYHDKMLLKWCLIVMAGLFYNSVFLEKTVRQVPLLKIFYVGLTWALMNAYLVLPNFSWVVFFTSFFYISALVLPFDIRDMNSDSVVTIPQLAGIHNARYAAYVLIFIALIICAQHFDTVFTIAFFLSAAVSFILIYFSENSRPDAYFSFGVELCSGLPLFFLVIMKYFW